MNYQSWSNKQSPHNLSKIHFSQSCGIKMLPKESRNNVLPFGLTKMPEPTITPTIMVHPLNSDIRCCSFTVEDAESDPCNGSIWLILRRQVESMQSSFCLRGLANEWAIMRTTQWDVRVRRTNLGTGWHIGFLGFKVLLVQPVPLWLGTLWYSRPLPPSRIKHRQRKISANHTSRINNTVENNNKPKNKNSIK